MNPLSLIYSKLSRARIWLYHNNFFPIVILKKTVISVGNLSVGGTGKTPVVDLIMTFFEKQNLKVGLVSRAYKAEAVDPVKINRQIARSARIYGDEPCWLANRHPQSVVYVGARKWQVAQSLDKNENVDVVILDDGFQHIKLSRKADILLLDASQTISHYQALPAGRAREDFDQFRRADFILLTKVQNVNPELELWFQKKGVFEKPVARLQQTLSKFRKLASVEQVDMQNFRRVLVVCALAEPDSFLILLQKKFSDIYFELLSYPDHYQYEDQDIQKIEQIQKEKNMDSIITTEKDEMKIRSLSFSKNWVVGSLALEFTQGEKEFYEYLRQTVS